MLFRMLLDDASGQMSYLLADQPGGEAVLIDPFSRDLPVLQALLREHRLRLRWVLRTHHHDGQDMGELQGLASLGGQVVQGDIPKENAREFLQSVKEGDTLKFGREQIRVLQTPGHTAHCLSYLWNDRLFSGGLLAALECPRQPVPAQPEELWESVTQRVFHLPDETLLFSGHSRLGRAVSTVLEARRWHPLFGCLTRDDYLARVQSFVTGLGAAAAPGEGALAI